MKSEAAAPIRVDRKAWLTDTLHQRILTLQMAAGTAVNEQALCEEFGLSRSTVRTTLLQLAAEGWLELHANRAPIVATTTPMTLLQFQQSAPLLYTATAQLAALNARPADGVRLHGLLARLEQSVTDRDLEAWLNQDHALHREISRLAGNEYLMPGASRLQIDHIRLCKTLYASRAWEHIQPELAGDCQRYRQLVEAIAGNDPQAATQIARSSIDTLCQRIGRYAVREPQNRAPSAASPSGQIKPRKSSAPRYSLLAGQRLAPVRMTKPTQPTLHNKVYIHG